MITQYHRPLTLDDAVALVARPDAVVLAGGTSVNADPGRAASTAVDLQALGSRRYRCGRRRGSYRRHHPPPGSRRFVPRPARAARPRTPRRPRARSAPWRPIGGTIGTADPESELLAGLLAFGARVTLARAGSPTEHSLETCSSDAGAAQRRDHHRHLGPHLRLGPSPIGWRRTPMDRPIVMAVPSGDASATVRLAMTGVASVPVLVDPEHIGGSRSAVRLPRHIRVSKATCGGARRPSSGAVEGGASW